MLLFVYHYSLNTSEQLFANMSAYKTAYQNFVQTQTVNFPTIFIRRGDT
jgi:hypothetical protein